jgi:hypothetical protein
MMEFFQPLYFLFGAVLFVCGYVAYHVGYVKGYKAGMTYGMERLEDYHQHTLANLRSMK